MTRRLVLLLVWGLFLAASVELTSRLVLFPEYTAMLPDMYAPHPVMGHYNKPNIEVRRFNPMNYDVINHTNSLGLRGLERNREKELAGIWIAGASNTFGGYVGDDEIFSARLRGYGYWAANLASEDHTIDQQVLAVRYLAREGYRPRAVLLSLPLFHVIRDYSGKHDAFTRPLDEGFSRVEKADRPRDRLLSAAEGLVGAFPRSAQSVRARLLKSSAFYGWLKVGIMGVPALRDWTLRTGLRNDLDYVANFDVDLLRAYGDGNKSQATIDSTADYVAAFGGMVREKFGVPFGAVLLPAHLQLHPRSFRRFVEHYGLTGQYLDARRPSEALRKALTERGVPVLDPYPELMNSGIGRMTFPDDGHMIPAAHAVVAETIAGWLARGMGSGKPIEPTR